jgi:hypothetical protein
MSHSQKAGEAYRKVVNSWWFKLFILLIGGVNQDGKQKK